MVSEVEKFYKNKRVFITGHTGFKGTWLCHFLHQLNCKIGGFSIESFDFFTASECDHYVQSYIGDVRDYTALSQAIQHFQPQILFHLAAQPLVLESFNNPTYTYSTNVMGTINLLEIVRHCSSIQAIVVITTDKVYEDNVTLWGYRETDTLGGHDPYSNSKACCEIVVSGYRKSFLSESDIRIATARAGNVIGGGDFSENRIIPDCVQATKKGKRIPIRNPHHIRPWQHVLDPLWGYLLLAKALWEKVAHFHAYNFGPERKNCISVNRLVSLFCKKWGEDVSAEVIHTPNQHESKYLKLDSSLALEDLNWLPSWNVEQAIDACIEWYKMDFSIIRMHEFMNCQIKKYMSNIKQ